MNDIHVIKQHQRPAEPFDPLKLHRSVVMSCQSVRTPDGQAEDIAKKVTLGVMRWCETRPTITSGDIRRQVVKHLTPLHTEAGFFYEHHKTIM